MRYIYISIILLVSFLGVEAQQLPEDLDYSSNYIRIPTPHVDTDFKVLKGKLQDEAQRQQTPSIIGKLIKDNSHTTFKPFVPFDLETPYTLVYNQQVFFFKIAKDDSDVPLTVTSIYPSLEVVPANILKWYVKFSKPVNPVKIYEHIQFRDEDGNPIDRSILHLGAPLLSSDGTLLTIWIEPGRQKRLLGPNEHLGSVFERDQAYSLYIANTLKDAQGLPIEASVTHTFKTIEPDRIKPSLGHWQVGSIKSNTLQALDITCTEQLDYGSLLDAFSVQYKGEAIEGQLNYDSEKNKVVFTPKDHWKKGEYAIHVAYQLEDLAGNNLSYLFDRLAGEGESEEELEDWTFTFNCY